MRLTNALPIELLLHLFSLGFTLLYRIHQPAILSLPLPLPSFASTIPLKKKKTFFRSTYRIKLVALFGQRNRKNGC